MDTLADLRDKDKPMAPERALAVAKVSSVLVDTARVEIDFLKATGRKQSSFLESAPPAAAPLQPSGYKQGQIERWPGGVRHTLGDDD